MSIAPVTTPAALPPPVQLPDPTPTQLSTADAVTALTSPAVIVGGSAAADPPATYAPTQYTDEVNKDVSALADGSGASLDDQLNAYVDLRDLLFNGSLLYNAGNQQDLQNAGNAYDNSALSKQMEQVGDQYSAYGMSAGRAAQASGQDLNPAAFNLSNIERFSDDQQKMLFVALMADSNYDTVDDWKQGMADNAQAWDNGQAPVHEDGATSLSQIAARFNLAGPQGMPDFSDLEALVRKTAADNGLIVAHTRNGLPIAIRPGTQAEEQAQIDAADLPPTAKKAAATGATATDGSPDDKTAAATQVLKTLTGPKTTYTEADMALRMLKASAKAQADAKAEAKADAKAKDAKTAPAQPQAPSPQTSPYQAGENLSLTA